MGDYGITFQFWKRNFDYFDDQLSGMRGREVQAWFNPEYPDRIAVTQIDDRDGRTARFVERVAGVAFNAARNPDTAEAEHYGRQVAKQQGFNSHPKARFHALKAKFEPNFRTVVTDRHTAAMAEALHTGRAAAETQQREDNNQRNRIMRKARDLGVPVQLRAALEAAVESRLGLVAEVA